MNEERKDGASGGQEKSDEKLYENPFILQAAGPENRSPSIRNPTRHSYILDVLTSRPDLWASSPRNLSVPQVGNHRPTPLAMSRKVIEALESSPRTHGQAAWTRVRRSPSRLGA
ncbi:unnamed protein product [Diplocarpon coronariae]